MEKEKLIEEINGALARGYCTEKNEKKTLDPDLIFAMTKEVVKILNSEYVEKANFEDMKQRNKVLRERPDLPADRLPAIEKYKKEIEALKEQICILGGERDIKAQAVDEKKNQIDELCGRAKVEMWKLKQEIAELKARLE